MGRILAIDYGKKRMGVAVTDPLRIIANPLITVNTNEIVDFLTKYLNDNEVDLLVLGYPRKMDNSPSETAPFVDKFINKIFTLFPTLKVVKVDERFTSKIAQRAMIDGGMKKSDRRIKGNVDKISASLILQSYLEQVDNKMI